VECASSLSGTSPDFPHRLVSEASAFLTGHDFALFSTPFPYFLLLIGEGDHFGQICCRYRTWHYFGRNHRNQGLFFVVINSFWENEQIFFLFSAIRAFFGAF
jgi:hypothetical protein